MSKLTLAIMYDLFCPTPKLEMKGVKPRYINNFCLAYDSENPDKDLFDAERCTGKLGAYDKMHDYNESTGVGSAKKGNLTTGMRRYSRTVDRKPAEHRAFNDRDERQDYLIISNKVMSV